MPLPKPPACERNRTPGLLTAQSLFSESQQLPLTGSFSPAVPPAPGTSGWSIRGLGPLGCLLQRFHAHPTFPRLPLRILQRPLPLGFSCVGQGPNLQVAQRPPAVPLVLELSMRLLSSLCSLVPCLLLPLQQNPRARSSPGVAQGSLHPYSLFPWLMDRDSAVAGRSHAGSSGPWWAAACSS